MISLQSDSTTLTVLRRFNGALAELSLAQEQLSSGLRINRPSDDAAGLAVSTSLDVDARLYAAATRNVNDGISVLHIMQGSLEAQSTILTRLSELAEQAANGSLASRQRQALAAEYVAMVREYGRIGDSAEFNGTKLLRSTSSESADELIIQAGVSNTDTSRIAIARENSASYSGVVSLDALASSGSLLNNTYTFDELAEATNGYLWETTGISTVDGSSTRVFAALVADSGRVTLIGFAEPAAAQGAPVDDYPPFDFSGFPVLFATAARTDIDPETGFLAAGSGALESGSVPMNGVTLEVDFSALRFTSTTIAPHLEEEPVLEFSGIETIGRSRSALDTLEELRARVSLRKATLGSAESRLSVAASISTTSAHGNLEAASRIRDADLATVSAKATAEKLRTQAAAAVLAQAARQSAISGTLLSFP